MRVEEKLRDLDVVMVSHVFVTGAFLDLEQFLKLRVKSLFFIGHPFSFRNDIRSFYRYYKKGILKKNYFAFPWRLPEVFWYIKDAFYTFWWILKHKGSFDMYLAADNFDAYIGLLLKKVGKVKDVVLYTIDYIPKRFKNPLLNALYHYFDRTCLKYCRIVWNISPVMASAREKFGKLKKEACVPQIVVPQGIWYARIPRPPLSKRQPYRIVFLGHLVERQGLELVIDAMKMVVKKIPKATLLIIGTGSYEKKLKELVAKKGLGHSIFFTGYMEKHEDIEKELSLSTIGVAMYKPDPKSLTNFADPMKIKVYLAAGLPIVLTNVPPIAYNLARAKCAIISQYDAGKLAGHIVGFLLNQKLLATYVKNAVEYSRSFDYEKVYAKAFAQSL